MACILNQIADVKQKLTKIKSELEVGLNELTEVTRNTKACETINKLHVNIVDLKAENDKLTSEKIKLKESKLCTEYITKKKNLILNGVKDYPKTGVKMEKILKSLFQTMFREDLHLANLIG